MMNTNYDRHQARAFNTRYVHVPVTTPGAVLAMAAVIVGVLITGTPARAASGTDLIAAPGQSVVQAEQYGWPTGISEMVSDPMRTYGLRPWFTQSANDVTYFEFQVTKIEDVNRLVARLSKFTGARVMLSPEKKPTLGRTEEGHNPPAAVVLSLGSQLILDRWWIRCQADGADLSSNEPVLMIQKSCPTKARPPTLALYVGNPIVDLKRLDLPRGLRVEIERYRAHKADPHVVKAVEKYVQEYHRAGLQTP